jgi:hypothetical protein
MNKLPNALIKATGEFYVAAELSKRGYIAAVTVGNTDRFDILGSDIEGKKPFTIQVKTTIKVDQGWILSEKDEVPRGVNSFYVFVRIPETDGRPAFYIVPSKILSRTLSKGHQKWLKTPGKKGQKHNDTSIRQFWDHENAYLEKWDILNGSK